MERNPSRIRCARKPVTSFAFAAGPLLLFAALIASSTHRAPPNCAPVCFEGDHWDIYALLRRQYKPVEMVMIPQGAHALSRPSERMISMQGNVDWYRFWLKGEQRSAPVLPRETGAALAEQYARWSQMVGLKRAVDAKPACVRAAGGG